MIHKCFLYIDDYPRNARDVPFDLSIDWGDSVETEEPVHEEYLRLLVEKIPPFYHLYKELKEYMITVTITNVCGSATKTFLHIPYVPPECACRNSHNLVRSDLQTSFSESDWDIELFSCFTKVVHEEENVLLELVTDASTNLELIHFPQKCEKLSAGVFGFIPPEMTREDVVRDLMAHTGNRWREIDNPLIPKMENNNIPSPYVASASSRAYHSGQPWRAFDQSGLVGGAMNTSYNANSLECLAFDRYSLASGSGSGNGGSGNDGSGSGGSGGAWLKIDLGEKQCIAGYALEACFLGSSYGVPKAWTLYGSNNANNTNDNGTWEMIHSESGVTSWTIDSSINETKTFALQNTSQEYRWYKLVLTGIHSPGSDPSYVALKGFQLHAPSEGTMVKEPEVDFIYTFNPTHVDRIELVGDEAFKDRVGTIILAGHEEEFFEECVWEEGEEGLYEVVIPIDRRTDTIRLSLSATTVAGVEAFYASLRIYIQSEEEVVLIQEEQDIFVGVNVFYGKDSSGILGSAILGSTILGSATLLGSAMSGRLVYESEEDQRMGHVEILCDANAKARFIEPEEMRWYPEDIGDDQSWWRGVIPLSGFWRELTFEFRDTNAEGQRVGTGTILAIDFYREIQPTEYDSPIMVDFVVTPESNEQTGLYYYVDERGWSHCASVNVIRLTPETFEMLKDRKTFQTSLNLTTSWGNISGSCLGQVNTDCLE